VDGSNPEVRLSDCSFSTGVITPVLSAWVLTAYSVVIAQDLILTAAQCIHPGTNYIIIGLDAPKTQKNVASTIVHPDWDPTAVLRHRVSADVALLKLAVRLPPAYMPVALADPKVVTVGLQVTVAGYGQAIAGDSKTAGTLRAADLVMTGNPGSLQIRLVDPNTER
jgi:Trypsin